MKDQGPHPAAFSRQQIAAAALFAVFAGFTSCKKELSPTNYADRTTEVTACETSGELMSVENSANQRTLTPLGTSSVVTIPVVFHVVYNQSVQNISEAQIQSQIDVLNEDFNGLNSDKANIPACFAPLAGNAQIHFTLAKRDPNGNATNGITRTYTNVSSFSSDGSVCFTSSGGHDAWPTNQYLNIWVCNKTGAAGSASYPWSGNAATDGIIAGYNFIGRTGTFTNNWNYQKGRTITHETGHWLGLGHIWGDAMCGDDLVADTPTQESANGANPTFPHVSNCSGNAPNGDMFMNFMDYTYDATRVLFTQAQVARMHYYLNNKRASLLTSLGSVAPSSSTTTCSIPSLLDAGNITSSSATLSWSTTGAASFNIRYRLLNSGSWITLTANTNQLSVSNLSASSTYEFQVESVCNASALSGYSGLKTFTTSANTIACNAPTGLLVTDITSVSAKVSWMSIGASSYNVRYRIAGSSSWQTITTSYASHQLTSLASGKKYELQVMSNCINGSTSPYSSVFFSTRHGKKV